MSCANDLVVYIWIIIGLCNHQKYKLTTLIDSYSTFLNTKNIIKVQSQRVSFYKIMIAYYLDKRSYSMVQFVWLSFNN